MNPPPFQKQPPFQGQKITISEVLKISKLSYNGIIKMNNLAAISARTECEFGLAYLRQQVCFLKPHSFNVQLYFCQFSAKSSSKNNTLTMKKKRLQTIIYALCKSFIKKIYMFYCKSTTFWRVYKISNSIKSETL